MYWQIIFFSGFMYDMKIIYPLISIKPFTPFTPVMEPSFKGHVRHEYLPESCDVFETQKRDLTQQTAFFRQMEELEFAQGYIEENFERKANIIVAGCSTGEEAWTLKMLLGDKADVRGFDLGAEAIACANSGRYEIVRDAASTWYHPDSDEYSDQWLAFDKVDGTCKVPKNSCQYKKLFEEYFEPDEELYAPMRYAPFNVRADKVKDCYFVQGDILKMDKFIKPDSVDVLTFRNALFHLTEIYDKPQITKEKKVLVLEKLFDQVNTVLKIGGLFVLGNHHRDIDNKDYINKILQSKGFTPALYNNADTDWASVWKKDSK